MRSLIFAPADSPRKLVKAMSSGADALIVDLEDSVPLGSKAAARANARSFLSDAASAVSRPRLFLRANALDSGLLDEDLETVVPGAPDAIVLPKATCGADVQRLGAKLAVEEARNGLEHGCIGILPIATESGAAIFGLATYAGASRRMIGLTWGAEDLSADLGAETNRGHDGALTEPYRLARSLTLFAAAAAGLDAFDTVAVVLRDEAALRAECEAARRDGFVGKLAIHPAQIALINAIFKPSETALRRAREILAAFAAAPGRAAIAFEGEMLDLPHRKRAERLLRRAEEF